MDGDKLVFTPGSFGALMTAFDMHAGKDIWRAKGGARDSSASIRQTRKGEVSRCLRKFASSRSSVRVLNLSTNLSAPKCRGGLVVVRCHWNISE